MVGNNLKDTQLQQIVDKTILFADKDDDGKINFEEFCTVRSVSSKIFSTNIVPTCRLLETQISTRKWLLMFKREFPVLPKNLLQNIFGPHHIVILLQSVWKIEILI